MQIGLIRMISTQKDSKPIINRVQNSTFWVLIKFDLSELENRLVA